MKDLKRYELELTPKGDGGQMTPRKDGGWCSYHDAMAMITSRDNFIRELQEQLKEKTL